MRDVSNIFLEATQFLHDHKCTFNEAERINSMIRTFLHEEREFREYATVSDWANCKKTSHADDEIVPGFGDLNPNI